eukprot:3653179-Amphidinium_carterae.1
MGLKWTQKLDGALNSQFLERQDLWAMEELNSSLWAPARCHCSKANQLRPVVHQQSAWKRKH